MSSSTYQLVKSIKIPYKACYNSGNIFGNDEYCVPCNNWKGTKYQEAYNFNYDERGNCNVANGPILYKLKTDNDFKTVKNDIDKMAIVENNGKFYCDVDNNGKCTGNYMSDNHLSKKWKFLYHATSFKDDQLLHDSTAKTIYIKLDDTAHSLNTAQNMFTGTCGSNQGAQIISVKTLLENQFGENHQWFDSDTNWLKYTGFVLPTPTHVTYSNTYTCQSLPEISSTSVQTKEYDMNDTLIEASGIDFDTNGIIDSITYDTSKDKMIVKYYTDSNYNIISNLGVQVTVPIKSTYTIIAKDHKNKPVSSSFSLIHLKDKVNSANNYYNLNDINTSLLQFSSNSYDLKEGTLTLKCPTNQYISGYSMKKDNDKNSIIVVPHCVKFEKKVTNSGSGGNNGGNGSNNGENGSNNGENGNDSGGSNNGGSGSNNGGNGDEETTSNATLWIIIAIVAVIIMIMLIVVLSSGKKTPDMAQLAAIMD